MTDRPVEHDKATKAGEWYADGLRFECTQCGNCCTGPPGEVWFTEDEAGAMARVLGETEDRFFKAYARKVKGRWSLQERRTEHGFDCVFLDRQTSPGKALCRVYRARPEQCGTWPFWPENLSSREAWESVKSSTPCPGMDHGPLFPVSRIRIIRDQSLNET